MTPGTIVVLLLVLAAVGGIVWKLIRDKREGKKSCGCGCENCPSGDICHKK